MIKKIVKKWSKKPKKNRRFKTSKKSKNDEKSDFRRKFFGRSKTAPKMRVSGYLEKS